MKRLKQTLCTLVVLFLSTGLLFAETVSSGGVSLTVPDGWTQRPARNGTPIILMAPERLPNFHPNINVTIQQTGKLSYEQYKEISIKETKAVGGVVTHYQTFKFEDGNIGRSMVLSFKAEGRDAKTLSVWRMSRGKTYLITGITLSQDFSKMKPIFQQISRTFRLK